MHKAYQSSDLPKDAHSQSYNSSNHNIETQQHFNDRNFISISLTYNRGDRILATNKPIKQIQCFK